MTRIPPEERIEWVQVEVAIPQETAAFSTLLKKHDLMLEEFCIAENSAIYDEDGQERKIPDEADAAWIKVQTRFCEVTGLQLDRYAYEERWVDRDWEEHDYQYGFEVSGAWQLSPAGKRFFGEDSDG